MSTIKVACWNIYYSDRLVKSGAINTATVQKTRADKVAEIIEEMDPDILGIVE